MEIALPANDWKPRPHQRALWKFLEDGGKRALAVWHRRAGKDEVCLHHAAVEAMRRPGNYWHCLPEFLQGRKAIWTAVNSHTGKRRIDEAFPPKIREATHEHDMFIRFVNGSTWQVIGSDRYDATVGSGVAGIVYSEWALANPSAWGYHRPILEENNGWACFITTPRGRNHAHDMYQYATRSNTWFSQVLTVRDTGMLTEEALADALEEYITLYGEDVGKAQFDQEYLCSFTAAILGAFYALEMAAVRSEGRIVDDLVHDPEQPVHTAWDIGVSDDTSIWWFQARGAQIYVLDHYSNSGVGVEHYAEVLREREAEHRWRTGTCFVPHDAKVKEWGSGRTRVETMQTLGLRPMLVRHTTKEDGINAARRTLPLCVFHRRTEEKGIAALEMYRREWDDEKKCYKPTEVRDWSTHPCLPGDAIIVTERGDIRIDTVQIGDRVATPAGWARVMAAGATGVAAELYQITTAAGYVLRCTGNHLVFTRRGLVHADALRYTDILLLPEDPLCRQISSYSKDKNIGFRDATIAVTTARDRATSIGRYGRMHMGRFRRAMTSTISTAIHSTMTWPTWPRLSVASISGGIQANARRLESSSLLANWRANAPPSGTPVPRAENGIGGTAKKLGSIANGICASVMNAAASIGRHIRPDPGSVTSIAKCPHCDVGGDSRLVYDLTVENHHCYVANGVLVSNSDAFRYLALAWKATARKPLASRAPIVRGWVIPPLPESLRGGIRL